MFLHQDLVVLPGSLEMWHSPLPRSRMKWVSIWQFLPQFLINLVHKWISEWIVLLNFIVEIGLYVIDDSEIRTFSFCKWDNRSPMKFNNLSRGTDSISQNQICIILFSFLLYHILKFQAEHLSGTSWKRNTVAEIFSIHLISACVYFILECRFLLNKGQ